MDNLSEVDDFAVFECESEHTNSVRTEHEEVDASEILEDISDGSPIPPSFSSISGTSFRVTASCLPLVLQVYLRGAKPPLNKQGEATAP